MIYFTINSTMFYIQNIIKVSIKPSKIIVESDKR